MTNDINCHCKPLVVHLLEEADIFNFKAVVLDKVTPTYSEHLPVRTTAPWDHPDHPCRALPFPQECQSLLPIWKVLSGILLAKGLLKQCVYVTTAVELID